MTGLMERLMELEADVRYQEPPSGNEPEFRYECGRVPVLLSAPHGAVHTRRGQSKEEDEYTAGIARLIAELTTAHALYARRRSDTDPNWYADTCYKERLREIVEESGIRFVLDLHGASVWRRFGIALGTMNGESCPLQREDIIRVLGEHGFRRDGSRLDRLDVDGKFTGKGKKGQETIIRFAWEELCIPAAQFELHSALRIVERRRDATAQHPFRGNPDTIRRAIRALAALIQREVLL